jgi:hypothetical protein
MSSIPPECQALADELWQLKQERASLQQELRSLVGPEKVNATRAINALLGRIQQKAGELDVCLGRPPLPTPRTCTLTSGVLFLSIGPRPMGRPALSIATPITPTFTFSSLNFATVQLFFPAVLLMGTLGATFPMTIVGTVRCPYAVTLSQSTGIGSFDSQLGEVDIPFSLVFNPSPAWSGFIAGALCPLLIAKGPSTLAGTLTSRMLSSSVDPTRSFSGFPLDRPTGNINLIMTGMFSGGSSQEPFAT